MAELLRDVELTMDGERVVAREGQTLLEVAEATGRAIPTLCYAENLTPVNVCRLCVVELEGQRTLAPACSRRVEAGMKVRTRSPRVDAARRLVLELLASSADLSAAPALLALFAEYGADPQRFGGPEHAHRPASPPRIDNPLFVRDTDRCVLCYKCVEACGHDAQHTFAIAVAGRGYGAHISTELDVPLPESACVFCGNCVGVCPTAALSPKTEFDLRQAGRLEPSRQTVTDTVCPYCGVGCVLRLTVQDERLVRVDSPPASPVTGGHLCIKGRFGVGFVDSGKP